MRINHKIFLFLILIPGILLLSGCGSRNANETEAGREPNIEPDYSGVTIPPNIAPLNFIINETGTGYSIEAVSSSGNKLLVRSSDGIVRFPERSWKKFLKADKSGKIEIHVISENKDKGITKFKPFTINIASDPIDPYLCYRLLYPGYETYLQIKIIQRCVENFKETSLVENQMIGNNCINCHSFNKNNPERFMIHIRGSQGGTYFINGDKITRTDLKTKEMTSGAVYPAWHPGGKYVTFSSNSIVQSFHSIPEKNIEVIDLASSLVIYDTEKNVISPVPEDDSVTYMETFPEWSPDGKYLYYCRAKKIIDSTDFQNIRYNLIRRSFDETSKTFGKAEVVFNASETGKSVSFPRISPDGKYLVFTLHNYGNFSIWHKEADLWLLDLQDGKAGKMSVNSDETESYHSWSSNGKWLVFSSKRDDGRTARPYFSYINENGESEKPFILPQKDPDYYDRFEKTFNIPEFSTIEINMNPGMIRRLSETKAQDATWKEK